MNFNLIKRDITLKEIICTKYCQTKAECDLIVPDTKPDVQKILQVCAKPAITRKTPQQDKVSIQGVLNLTVIYIADDGKIKSIFTKLDFNCTADCEGTDLSSHIYAEADLEEIDYQTLNSRKINIKCSVGIDIKSSRKIACAIPTGFENDCNIITRFKDYSISCLSPEEEQNFRFRERIEVPAGKPDIQEIIKTDARCCSDGIRYEDGRISISGDIIFRTVYSDQEGYLSSIEETLPFNETFGGVGLPEGEPDVCLSVCDISFDIFEEDGIRRWLNIDILICASFKVSQNFNMCGIDDAFSTETPVRISRVRNETESIIDKNITQIAHKDSVLIPDYLPAVFRIADCSGEARVTGISIENGRITVDGEILSNILYSSDDENAHLSGMSHISSFSQTIDSPFASESSICEAKVFLDHISYSISADKEVELRFIVVLTLSLLRSEAMEIIEDISPDEDASPRPLPSAVIYFADENETIWDIAKRFWVTPESIITANKLDDDILKKGQRICIFK